MSAFWTPETNPPQLTDDAELAVRSRLGDADSVEIVHGAIAQLENEDPLMAYIDELGFELNKGVDEGPWPARALKVSAAITLFAYREAGVEASITDEAMDMGHFMAELYGVPETYIISSMNDGRLVNVTRALVDGALFDETYADRKSAGGFQQVGTIGSGCVRHYLQQAMEIAA